MRRYPPEIKPAPFLAVVAIVGLVLSGCATVRYTPYTTQGFTPKSPNSMLVGLPGELTHRQYKVIGKLEVCGYSSLAYTTSQNSMIEQFLDAARKHGADGIANPNINQTPYQAAMYMPGYTTYQPVTTYNQGTATASAFGTGGYAQGYGTYNGTSTTYAPINNPGQVIPYVGVVNSMSGDLIVLLDKDTFGYSGIAFDPFAKNVPGVLIQAIKPGGAAEQAGLAVGDVVTAIGGIKVASLEEIYMKTTPRVGEPIQVAFIRSGKSSTVTLIPQRGNYD